MKLADLKFDNPNNACISLRVLAERVRAGEVLVTEATDEAAICEPVSAALMVGFSERNANAKK